MTIAVQEGAVVWLGVYRSSNTVRMDLCRRPSMYMMKVL
jgi:hypothetical protein